MTFFRKPLITNIHSLTGVVCAIALGIFAFSSQAQQTDTTALSGAGREQSSTSDRWQSSNAIHLIGFPEIKEKGKGSLSISPSELMFISPEGRASVQRTRILNVSIGDVNIESGGTTGKVTRAIIPFGGGSALATVTHKNLGLLTIEFRDSHGALHGAVFLLAKDDALQAQRKLGSYMPTPMSNSVHQLCETTGGIAPKTINVAAFTLGDPVPAEYKMLIYEQLVRRLHDQGFAAVYRDGDDEPEAACPGYHVVLMISAFKKGNAAVRASTGPVGFFVGATSLTYHVQVKDLTGRMLLDKEFKASQRGDTDSLNIAEKVAKTMTKEIRKAGINATHSR